MDRIAKIVGGLLTMLLGLSVGVSVVWAALGDVKFPIAELGNCEDYSSCFTYCDDPVNNSACVEYAKKNGFYKEDETIAPDDEFWAKAKGALGCDNKESCMEFCSKVGNHAACDKFAKENELVGGYVEEPDNPEILDKAKETLGCDTAESCKSFCEQEANHDKCAEFAGDVGLIGGDASIGPGGCNSVETCESYCRDPNNFEACRDPRVEEIDPGFNIDPGSVVFSPGDYRGPGGCSDKKGCRTYCEENPEECRSYGPGSNGSYVPVACQAGEYFGPGGACTPAEKTKEATGCAQGGKYWDGQSCKDSPPPGINPTVGGGFFQARSDMGNCKTPGECYDYCKANPGTCGGFKEGWSRPPDTYVPNLYYTPGIEVKHAPVAEMGGCDSPGKCYDYCKENPAKCQGFDSKSPRPFDTYAPGTYYTPPRDFVYSTPPATSFYVTPIYYTPPPGSNYTTPSYYTPGLYSTPSYYTPPTGSTYTTPSYYSPGTYYVTPTGNYPTPTYNTPSYYTPPTLANYSTPSYYTPHAYVTPYYYTPPPGSTYTTPTYNTPPAYTTPTYYTPYDGGTSYTSPTYYTPPPGYTTPTYVTPGYYTPYSTPHYSYPTPGSNYTTPGYLTPYNYPTPGTSSPVYSYPTPGSGYSYPTPSTYYYPTPSDSYAYPTPGTNYGTPPYATPTGAGGYGTPTYGTPSYGTPGSGYSYPSPSYGTPSYGTPSYGTPEYSTPSYGTPSYGTPEYGTPSSPPPPPPGAAVYKQPSVAGTHTQRNQLQIMLAPVFDFFGGLFGR